MFLPRRSFDYEESVVRHNSSLCAVTCCMSETPSPRKSGDAETTIATPSGQVTDTSEPVKEVPTVDHAAKTNDTGNRVPPSQTETYEIDIETDKLRVQCSKNAAGMALKVKSGETASPNRLSKRLSRLCRRLLKSALELLRRLPLLERLVDAALKFRGKR